MPRAAPLVAAFNAGEFSPRLEGRADLAQYQNACRIVENFTPLVAGGVRKRSGTAFVAEVKDSSKPVLLVSFEFSSEQQYVLEFGDFYMRVYMDGAPVIDSSTGLVYELTTPYASGDVIELQMHAQSADVLYLAHPRYAPRKVSRTAHDAWTIAAISFSSPPFSPENTDKSLRLFISASTGTGVTLKSTSALFTEDDVGRFIRLREVPAMMHEHWEFAQSYSGSVEVSYDGRVYQRISGTGSSGTAAPIHDVIGQRESDGTYVWELLHYGYGHVEIKTFVSSTEVTADVIARVPTCYVGTADNDPGSKTHYERYRWAWSAFDAVNGYPQTVTFFEDRLLWAGTAKEPQTLWGSCTGDYENHRTGEHDDDAILFTINSDQINRILWLSAWKYLTLGTSGGEIVAPPTNPDEGVTATNPPNFARNQSTYGSEPGIRPVRIENALLFAPRQARKVRELIYEFDSDSYIAPDVTLLADHIAASGVRQMAYQQEPNRLLWCVMQDGTLAALTYDRSQKVLGWHRHVLGGTDVGVESVAVLRGSDGDEVWLAVRRTIDGATQRYVELLTPEWRAGLSLEGAIFMDSSIGYSGIPATTFSGLDHLEGEYVQVLADGAVLAERRVVGGEITLDDPASRVTVGLGYVARVQTMRLEAGTADGTAQGRHKQVQDVVVRLDETGAGLYYGGEVGKLDPVYFRTSSDLTGTPVPLFSGDTPRLAWPGRTDRDARLTFEHRLPLPCTILAAMPRVNVEDR